MWYNNEIMVSSGVPPPLLNFRSPYRKIVPKSPLKFFFQRSAHLLLGPSNDVNFRSHKNEACITPL